MSYNILAETDKKIDFNELHEKMILHRSIEYVPMPDMGINGGDALGISIPSKMINDSTWGELEKVIEVLKKDFNLSLYDMYYGEIIDSKMMAKVKENLYV